MPTETITAHGMKVKLGRVRPAARALAPLLSHYFAPLPGVSPPPFADLALKAKNALRHMYANDKYGCCVVADRFHAVGVWTGNDGGVPVEGTDKEVVSQYLRFSPHDQGCVISQVLDYTRTKGLVVGGAVHKIDGYAHVDWRDQEQVKAAIYAFGDVTIGINLPQAWTQAKVWDVTGSRIVGGHDVLCVGYTAQGVQVSSWGQVFTITWRAFTSTRWLEEAYAVLSPDWYGSDRLAPCGIDAAALRADLAKFTPTALPELQYEVAA